MRFTLAGWAMVLVLAMGCGGGKSGGAADARATPDSALFPEGDANLPDAPVTVDDAGPAAYDSRMSAKGDTADAPGSLRPLPARLYGVTLDDIAPIDDIVPALASLKKMPVARIVFDEGQAPAYYLGAVTRVREVAFVMGELVDSAFVKDFLVADYTRRTTDYLDALGGQVDIWEVGNEINGEWLGATPDVVAKMTGAFDLVSKRGLRTALTLYWNASCHDTQANEMFAWTEKNVPASMKNGLDLVLVSYYEDDCVGARPDWNAVFKQLAALFPAAKLGIGECGTQRVVAKPEFIARYYGMTIAEPRFVGGWFWWYFVQDMVPSTRPLWSTLDASLK
jgi:hypothetical protein